MEDNRVYKVGDIVCDYKVYNENHCNSEPTRAIFDIKSNAEMVSLIANYDYNDKSLTEELEKRIDREIEFAKSCQMYQMVAGMIQLKKIVYEVLELTKSEVDK